MNNTLIFAILIFTIISTFYTIEPTDEYLFHFYKAQGQKCPEPYIEPYCSNYPFLPHLIMSPFSTNFKLFVTAHLFLMVIIIPIILKQITKKDSTALIYFATPVWTSALNGTLAESFAILLFLFFLIFQKPGQRILLILIGLVVHNSLIQLFLLYWFFELIWNKKNSFGELFYSIPAWSILTVQEIVKHVISVLHYVVPLSFLLANKKSFVFWIVVFVISISLWMPRVLWVAGILIALGVGKKELSLLSKSYYLIFVLIVLNEFVFKNSLAHYFLHYFSICMSLSFVFWIVLTKNQEVFYTNN